MWQGVSAGWSRNQAWSFLRCIGEFGAGLRDRFGELLQCVLIGRGGCSSKEALQDIGTDWPSRRYV